jgi:magnesium transporter
MAAAKFRKTGLPPGSLIYTGAQKSDVILKEFIRYNAEHIDEIPLEKEPEFNSNYQYWLDVRGIHNPAEIEELGKKFGLDPLLLEDVLDPDQRPKYEQTEKGVFIVLKILMPTGENDEFLSEQFSIFLSDGFRSLKVRMQQANSRLRTRRSDYLAYAIIDLIADQYFPVLDSCSDRIQFLEDAINTNPSQNLKSSFHKVRQDITEIRRILLPTRETINGLMRTDNPSMTEKTRRYLRDVMDNLMQMIDMNDDQAELLNSLHDLHMSEMSYRMTEVVKILTVITSIFIPLTFITSVYGMNFKHQPEYNWPWAYPALWIIMIIVAIVQVIYFWRKKWL